MTALPDAVLDRLRGGYGAASERDFFIRKAIGWALREHAKTDAPAVRAFVAAHPGLSPPPVREALKHA